MLQTGHPWRRVARVQNSVLTVFFVSTPQQIDVPLMTQEWDSDGWRVARIHTLKVGEWYKAEVRYTMTTAEGTIHNFNHSIWREPTPHFRPTGSTFELDNPGEIIFTWYCAKDDPENQLASA